MPPLKVSRPACQPAVYCLTDVSRCGSGAGVGGGGVGVGGGGGVGGGVSIGGGVGGGIGNGGGKRGRGRRLLLTPYGIFLGDDGAVFVVASPGAVAAVTAAAATGNRDPPVAHAVISEWTQLEFEVRAGLRESPLTALEGVEAVAAEAAGTAEAAETVAADPAPAPVTSSSALQVMPMGPGRFLLFVQGFATIMSTIMLIRKAVDSSMFESIET